MFGGTEKPPKKRQNISPRQTILVDAESRPYNSPVVTVNAHFDGNAIVADEPLGLPAGARLRVQVETVDGVTPPAPPSGAFQPLDIKIDPELSRAIASDHEFNIEES